MYRTQTPNRLIYEKSPYLLQHAYNPVDWYPWGEEAFSKAHQEDKPVFLSIGYSTCHWCHVMAHESFEDKEVAALLNRSFVPVKVDREERPDVDAVYMAVCQMFTGQGGWPMTVLLTPDQKPFFAGTYFPKNDQRGMPGLITLLQAVADQWQNSRDTLLATSKEAVRLLTQDSSNSKENELSTTPFKQAYAYFSQMYDKHYGGFGGAPKFPTPHNLLFLMRYAYYEKDNHAMELVEGTLRQMYRGGIFDHIGGGFSRYSTDAKWLIPHFEKMLYDNALLTISYLEAFQITRNPLYRRVAERTIGYVLRELSLPHGGFASAQDADTLSEDGTPQEGGYYLLTPDEIRTVLGKTDGDYFIRHFGITEQGHLCGRSIPNLLENESFARYDERIPPLCEKLLAYRQKRATLHRDDKALTSWNALMIVALAKAAFILKENAYLSRAKEAMAFIQDYLTAPDGRLFLRYRDGEAAVPGLLEDYAFTVWALLCLYETEYDATHLQEALRLTNEIVRLFGDGKEGGFFLYGNDVPQLIARPKETYDGAIPSGNSVAGYVLEKLSALTVLPKMMEWSRRQAAFLAGSCAEHPAACSFGLTSLQLALYPSTQAICVLEDEEQKTQQMREITSRQFHPSLSILVKTPSHPLDFLPVLSGYLCKDGQDTFYVCRDHVCSATSHDPQSVIG